MTKITFKILKSLTGASSRRGVFGRQIASFAGVGVVATTIHYLVLIIAVQAFGASPVRAALLGYSVGGFVSYRLNRRHTFASDRPHSEAVWRFATVAGVGFLLTFLLMVVAVDRWHVPYLLAQAVTTCLVMVWTFTANRIWTFPLMPGRLR